MILLFLSISKSFSINLNEFDPDKGVIALMYHRFNENKYPSTNIRNEIFLEHLDEINNSKFEFISFNKFREVIKSKMDKNYLLLTIDDAFESFYSNAWPVLKERKIPFILFVSTREMNKNGYMTWEQIKEIKESKIIEQNESKFMVAPQNITKYFNEKILKLNNLHVVNLDHNELELLQINGLLDKNLIKPMYLS